jgi:hypothetical protein
VNLYELYQEPPINFLRVRFEQIVLPTEIVLRNLTPPLPRLARVYETKFWIERKAEGSPVRLIADADIRRLIRHDDKTWWETKENYEQVKLLEYYENSGDDGHMDMEMRGWVFVRESDAYSTVYTDWNNYLSRHFIHPPYKEIVA